MSLKAIGAILLAVAVLAAPLVGEATAQESRGRVGVVITSSPSGAVVELRGDHVLSGVTPWRLDRPFSGVYEVHAAKAGYADWYGSTSLSATRQDSLFIRMSRKTPLATGLRSAILPGWGQFYAGQNLKGTVFLLAEIGAVSGVLYADAKREDAMSDYESKRRIYNTATQADEISDAYLDMLAAFDDLDRWHENRKRWIYAAGAIWLANVLDATLLIPHEGGALFSGLPETGRTGLFTAVDADKTVVGFSVAF